MLRLTLAFVVAKSSALAFQPVHTRSAVAFRGAAAVRSAAAVMMANDEATRDSSADLDSGSDVMATGETRAELIARLRSPIRQYDGGWADIHGRYGGKNEKKLAESKGQLVWGTGGGRRLDEQGKETNTGSLPAEKQAQLVLPEESFKVSKMEMSQTDEDFVMECAEHEEAELFIDIEPMFLTAEEYFYGFTADSDPKFTIDPGMSSDIEGVMNAKDHSASSRGATLGSLDRATSTQRIMIKLKFKPEYQVGEFEAHLCFIFPSEKSFSKFYKITGKSTSA